MPDSDLAETRSAKRLFLDTGTRAARSQLSIDRDRRHRANTQIMGAFRHLDIVHVEDGNLARAARDAIDKFDGALANGTARTEHFDFALGSHGISPG
jgi:hypothetical protein